MNYKKVHDQIIDRAKSRILDEGNYYERHHVVPRCMGGLDSLDNLVSLTAREHFLIHWLLVEIYRGTEYLSKLSHAWNQMCRVGKGQESRKVNSRYYKYAREERAKVIRCDDYDKEIVIFDEISREIRYEGKLRFCGVYPSRVHKRLIDMTPSLQGKYEFCSYYMKEHFYRNETNIRLTPWDVSKQNYQKGSKSQCRELKIKLTKGNFICETTLDDFSYSISRFHSQALKGHTYKHGPLKNVRIQLCNFNSN